MSYGVAPVGGLSTRTIDRLIDRLLDSEEFIEAVSASVTPVSDNNFGVIFDGGEARPTDFEAIMWICDDEPSNGLDGDSWIPTSPPFQGKIYVRTDGFWGGLFIVGDGTYESGSLDDMEYETGLVIMEAGALRFTTVTTDFAARVRVYETTAHRDADVARDLFTDPSGDHGVVMDVVTSTMDLGITLDPQPEATYATANVPITVTNLSGATRSAITAVLESA